jgi:hypothetical protein
MASQIVCFRRHTLYCCLPEVVCGGTGRTTNPRFLPTSHLTKYQRDPSSSSNDSTGAAAGELSLRDTAYRKTSSRSETSRFLLDPHHRFPASTSSPVLMALSSWFGLSLPFLHVLGSSFASTHIRRLAPPTPNMASIGPGTRLRLK